MRRAAFLLGPIFLICRCQEAGLSTAEFPYGVASGDPSPSGFVIWTRVGAPPLDAKAAWVQWKVWHTGSGKQEVGLEGLVQTDSATDWTVKVVANSLLPDTRYYYQFALLASEPKSGENATLLAESLIGSTRSTPALDASASQLRIGVVSCSCSFTGFFPSYRHLADRAERGELDLVVHLGDYIYADMHNWPKDRTMRRPAFCEARDTRDYEGKPPDAGPYICAASALEEWRASHAFQRSDPDLQRLHQHVPWTIIWDDHDLKPRSKSALLGPFRAQSSSEDGHGMRWQWASVDDTRTGWRAAARAFWEWTPTRPQNLERPDVMYKSIRWGTLAHLVVLDDRIFRGSSVVPGARDMSAAWDRGRFLGDSMLGEEQWEWFEQTLQQNQASAWLLVGSQTLTAPWTKKHAGLLLCACFLLPWLLPACALAVREGCRRRRAGEPLCPSLCCRQRRSDKLIPDTVQKQEGSQPSEASSPDASAAARVRRHSEPGENWSLLARPEIMGAADQSPSGATGIALAGQPCRYSAPARMSGSGQMLEADATREAEGEDDSEKNKKQREEEASDELGSDSDGGLSDDGEEGQSLQPRPVAIGAPNAEAVAAIKRHGRRKGRPRSQAVEPGSLSEDAGGSSVQKKASRVAKQRTRASRACRWCCCSCFMLWPVLVLCIVFWVELGINRDAIDYGAWDGFPAERVRFYNHLLRDTTAQGVVKLSGHIHHTVLADLVPDGSSEPIGVEVLPFSISRPNIRDVVDDHGEVYRFPRWLVRGLFAVVWQLSRWLNPDQLHTAWGHGFGVITLTETSAIVEIFEVDASVNNSDMRLKARAVVDKHRSRGFHSVEGY